MKTLDEVIEKIEKMWVCPSSDEDAEYCDLMEVKEDALHYLKEYQRYQNTPSRIGHMAMVDLEDNPPLTYDELLQMGRKPVWIEWLGPRKRMSRWWIIDHDANECPGKDILLSICTSGTRREFLMRDEEGKTWQAYRKERG